MRGGEPTEIAMIMVAFRRAKQLSVRHSQSRSRSSMGRRQSEQAKVSNRQLQKKKKRERERESEWGGRGARFFAHSFKTPPDIAKTLEQST